MGPVLHDLTTEIFPKDNVGIRMIAKLDKLSVVVIDDFPVVQFKVSVVFISLKSCFVGIVIFTVVDAQTFCY